MPLMTTNPGDAFLVDVRQRKSRFFTRPRTSVVACRDDDVISALRRVEALVEEEKLIAVGFVSYQAAPAFDPALVVVPQSSAWPPRLLFHLYPQATAGTFDIRTFPTAQQPINWTAAVSKNRYRRQIETIRDHIRKGDTYQVNYTLRLHAEAPENPDALFAALMHAQQPAYGALLRDAGGWVCSASPELFFRLEGSRLTSEPMKGTVARGFWPGQDRQRAVQLQRSPKNLAENLMIVDMVRNDLSRIAQSASVRAGPLCTLEAFPTVWQMVSRVSCRTDAGLTDIFAATFPAASITGAPKARTMQIIRDLENDPRGLYCGAIGWIAPGRKACFSVAIRTISADLARKRATYGVGGGIVWDSRSHFEYEECRQKAAILNRTNEDFQLIETLRWTRARGFFLLEPHLRRLRTSARWFGFPVQTSLWRRCLQDHETAWSQPALRVRISLSRRGCFQVETADLPSRQPVRLALADAPLDAANPFLYHKTTQRACYRRALDRHPEADDVLLWNTCGELTESCTANLLVRVGDRWITPRRRCGLLAGVYRNWLLRRGLVHEGVIRREDLPRNPDNVRLINALRRSRRVCWVEAPA